MDPLAKPLRNGETPIAPLAFLPPETVERRVEISTEEWARDLRALFVHAKERFGDVSWESEEGQERVWGHKAIIYARAPKAFKERYFISRPFSRSPTSLRSPSPHLLPPLFPSARTDTPLSSSRLSPLPGRSSSLSVNTIQSDWTVRATSNDDTVLRLTHGDTPELFQAQLEWLYTGEGFGDVVEWISAEDDSGLGGSIRDSLGRRGGIHERRDKLGQDLTYMWRSKLYADIKIHLDTSPSLSSDPSSDDDSDDSTDSLSSTATFTSHKFILVSRSPYFASVLLNPNSFSEHQGDIHLPTPPFTPASLHFCLGWIYAGHLDFSNRSFDLTTAFQIHRAAAYLQLDALVEEIQARVVWDFCHGFTTTRGKVHCKRCPLRAARVWRFASATDVGAVVLAARAKEHVIVTWTEAWGREVALADEPDRKDLVDQVIRRITPDNVIAAFRSVGVVKARMDAALRAKGREAASWVDKLETMVESVQQAARRILFSNFGKVVEGREMWDLLSGKGFNDDLLDLVGKELLEAVGTSTGCVEGPRVYQAIVSSILLKVDPTTLQTVLPPRGRTRQQVEAIKDGVVGHIRRRWMQVRDLGGFDDIENWALKEISDEIEVSIDDLLAALPTTPRHSRVVSLVTPTSSSPAARSCPQAGPSRLSPLARNDSETAGSRSRVSLTPRQPVPRSSSPPGSSGLRRLRLSSSASTNSVTSARSVSAPHPRMQESMVGPRARSPTAARQGATVTIGAGRRNRPNGAASPSPSTRTARTSQAPTTTTPRSISGPPRPLLTRPSRPSPAETTPRNTSSPGPTPSVTSLRSNTTARSATTVNARSTTRSVAAERNKDNPSVEAGPSRPRTASVSTTTSLRKPPMGQKAAAPVVRPPVPSSRAAGSKDAGRLDAPEPRQRTASVSTTTAARSKAATGTSKAPSLASKPSSVSLRSVSTTSKGPAIGHRAPSTASKASSIAPSIASRTIITNRPSPKAAPTPAPRSATPRAGVSSVSKPSSPAGATVVRSTPTSAQGRQTTTKQSPAAATTLNTARSARPPLRTMKPVAFPAAPNGSSGVKPPKINPTLRSASASTDDAPEARTPRTSLQDSHPEPKILRDGSDISDMAIPNSTATGSSSPTKPPPVSITMPRPTRKVSSSSTHSNSSVLRLHPASAFDPPRRVDVPPTPLPVDSAALPAGVERFKGKGVELNVGVPCIVSLASKRARFRAAIKYIGQVAHTRGPWVGLEVDDLDRLGVETLPAGVRGGVHYFHLTPPNEDAMDEARLVRQRRIESIRETLRVGSRAYGAYNNAVGMGSIDPLRMRAGSTGKLSVPGAMAGGPTKRSVSPFMEYGQGFGFENPRALFVRPSEIVFVMGAE